MSWIAEHWNVILATAAWIVGAAVIGLVAHRLLYRLARQLRRGAGEVDSSFARHSFRPTMLIAVLLAVLVVLPGLPVGSDAAAILRHAVILGLILGAGWFLISMLNVVEDLLTARYRIDQADNLDARRVRTQYLVLRRTMGVVIGVLTIGAMLMTLPQVGSIGAGLFASAGFSGIVIGIAASPTLTNLAAGIQLALTEPIRLDDVVIVDGEWGRIEEITTTYVVVRIWDLRRLVVPLTYFTQRSFENWTRVSADLLGTVFLYTDYRVPVEEVRQELHRILQSTDKWDGKVWNLQVTDASDRTVELRALMSASDSGVAWDLRCLVRERLIAFLQERYPDSLPRIRAEVAERTLPEERRQRAQRESGRARAQRQREAGTG